MIDKIVIADASPLIAFGKIKRLKLLADVLGKIITPIAVIEECLKNLSQPGAKEISQAINNKIIHVHENPEIEDVKFLQDFLGKGEANAIILASQLEAKILIDEKLGRKIASEMNLRIIGTAGVLLIAKEKKLIKKVMPVINELKQNNYFLSQELIEAILKISKE